jgi:hypothetical protein
MNAGNGEIFGAAREVAGFNSSNSSINIGLGFIYYFWQFIAAHSRSSYKQGGKANE